MLVSTVAKADFVATTERWQRLEFNTSLLIVLNRFVLRGEKKRRGLLGAQAYVERRKSCRILPGSAAGLLSLMCLEMWPPRW